MFTELQDEVISIFDLDLVLYIYQKYTVYICNLYSSYLGIQKWALYKPFEVGSIFFFQFLEIYEEILLSLFLKGVNFQITHFLVKI